MRSPGPPARRRGGRHGLEPGRPGGRPRPRPGAASWHRPLRVPPPSQPPTSPWRLLRDGVLEQESGHHDHDAHGRRQHEADDHDQPDQRGQRQQALPPLGVGLRSHHRPRHGPPGQAQHPQHVDQPDAPGGSGRPRRPEACPRQLQDRPSRPADRLASRPGDPRPPLASGRC
ncbi:MAG: hypothetical protein F4189_02645 [Acidimicrobiaceae bacterium]|nr:hypothetical protein [Acidimicrobiaceae bacterium]